MTRYLSPLPLALLVLASAACVPRAAPPTPVAPAPTPAPAPAPLPAPMPVADWQDWPWTPGAWRYTRAPAGPLARYGVTGQAPAAELRCDRAARALLLSRPGSSAMPFTIRTSAMSRSVATQLATGAIPQVVARFALDDRLLDAMAFTRGRFTIEQPGTPPLVLPPWAEVGRVIEDCRG
ncbi:hypothetical protein F4693_000370 [Sphingomonas endophytica]|uniref:Lipoprotein n=1 Tax=Sphingomonas endophytica TaxID=869719 RepID=A0A7X0ML98_9SPHN|nr:hypothetical protein [Sphingomonas endophytica]MBB6503417.1 hypothetical protein [Sphingomonas endophytica]